jgi:hypothetical protein
MTFRSFFAWYGHVPFCFMLTHTVAATVFRLTYYPGLFCIAAGVFGLVMQDALGRRKFNKLVGRD